MHGCEIFFSIHVDIFFLSLEILRWNRLPFKFGIIVSGLLNEVSVNRLKVLGFNLRVGFIPRRVMSVFLSSPVH